METKFVDYNTFVNFKESTNILIFLFESANQKHFDRFCLEFTTQLIESQLKAITSILKGEGHRMNPGNVMDRIEDVFRN